MAGLLTPNAGGYLGADALNLQIIDPVLTTIAKQFSPHGYIYDRLVAPMNVPYQAGQYPIFDPSFFFADPGNLAVADDAPTPIVDPKWSMGQFNAIDYRLATKITRKEYNQANALGDPLRLQYSKTKHLLTLFAAARERRLAAKLLPTGSGGQLTTTASTPTVKWDAGTSSVPATIQQDIQAADLAVYKATGYHTNTLVINYEIALAIAADFTVKDQIKYIMGPQIISEGVGVLPGKLFGKTVIIADGTLINGSPEGTAISLSDIWGNQARLLYIDPAAQWGQPSVAYAFRAPVTGSAGSVSNAPTLLPSSQMGEEPGGGGSFAVVERWAELDPPADHIRAWECVDENVVAPELGVVIPTVLGSY